ncbi:hypothetical protein WMY93_012445 [Mugilogobius chulae]|uniref:B box-type domain-containing protein n=1 Tax=Mugilogobius chulae TaxID=88201 RepID=A0AAW0P924_9GOBI
MERSQSRAFALCDRHNNPLTTYCCTDDKVICATCASTEHIGHTIGLVREERKRKQDELKKLKKSFQELLRREDRSTALVQAKARETEDFCEAVLASIIDLLQTHYMSLRQWVENQEKAALKSCTGSEGRGGEEEDWPSVHQLCKKDLTEFTDLKLPFDSLQNKIDSLGNQLEEFCNKGFAAITKNGFDHLPSRTENYGFQQPDMISYDPQNSDEMTVDHQFQGLDEMPDDVTDDELFDDGDDDDDEVTSTVTMNPKTRADFLQYACNLTLDPNTAHKDLLVSPDFKEVKLVPETARGPAVRHPDRFLQRKQLLCKEGLQADHYYEVEVTGCKTEIALAYGAIDRKRFKQSGFGGMKTPGAWTARPLTTL